MTGEDWDLSGISPMYNWAVPRYMIARLWVARLTTDRGHTNPHQAYELHQEGLDLSKFHLEVET